MIDRLRLADRLLFRGSARASLAMAIAAWVQLAAASSAYAGDPNALWTIVHGVCVFDEQTLGHPAPCSEVNLQKGYAVLKDISGATQYLLIPTDRISGIESPKLLAPSTPNYFDEAWNARTFVSKSIGRDLPREDIGLAINSYYGRSQNQLHIHIDCVGADVRAVLDSQQGRISKHWSVLKARLHGRRYRAMRIDGADLMANPFTILAKTDPTARADMGRETLIAIGATFKGKPGFYLLSDRATLLPLDRGSGEDLLDHTCKIAR